MGDYTQEKIPMGVEITDELDGLITINPAAVVSIENMYARTRINLSGGKEHVATCAYDTLKSEIFDRVQTGNK